MEVKDSPATTKKKALRFFWLQRIVGFLFLVSGRPSRCNFLSPFAFRTLWKHGAGREVCRATHKEDCEEGVGSLTLLMF